MVGNDHILLVANKDAKVKKLSATELQSVFTGKTKNWKELGGADLPIRIATHKVLTAKNDIFEFVALKGQKIAGQIEPIHFPDENDYMDSIAKMPGAIGILAVSKDSSKVQLLETVELGRPVTIISKGKPSDLNQKLFAYIRNRKDLFK